MHYYQLTAYDIPDLCLSRPGPVTGPYTTHEDRDAAFREEVSTFDLETGETLAVSFFKVENSQLTLEHSFIANPEGDPIPAHDEEDDEDEDDEEFDDGE